MLGRTLFISHEALLRGTLETSGQWGAVRVIPASAEFVDVMVSGKIIESTGQMHRRPGRQ